ncbi:hypothetical protein [Catenovulum sediminis]|uniref:hypothetical protein n=1 Tax=Catenovulum sediminis TaxID=1740262 RepID=UPI00117C0E11|nr:hypothetical protein [Catenovulum sediminis]
MPLCVGLHGGVPAFGNALGNSIVEGMKSDSSSKAAAKIQEIQNSNTDDTTKKLAIQKVYEEEGVSFGNISDDTGSSGGSGKRGFSGIHGAYDNDGHVHFTRYENGNAMNDTFSGLLDGTFKRAKFIHSNFLNWAGNDLSTSGSALGFSSMMYNHRIDTQRQALAMSSAERQAIYESRMRRIDLGRSTNSWDVGNTSTWTGSMKYAMTGANGALSDDFMTAVHTGLDYANKAAMVIGGLGLGVGLGIGLASLTRAALPTIGRGFVSMGRASLQTTDDVALRASAYGQSALRQVRPVTNLGFEMGARSAVHLGRVEYTGFAGTLNSTLGRIAGSTGFQGAMQSGTINGFTNGIAEYAFKGSEANVLGAFVNGFIGGGVGYGVAQKVISGARGFVGGAVGSGLAEWLGQDSFSAQDILISSTVGGGAGLGFSKVFRNMPMVLPTSTRSLYDSSIDSF